MPEQHQRAVGTDVTDQPAAGEPVNPAYQAEPGRGDSSKISTTDSPRQVASGPSHSGESVESEPENIGDAVGSQVVSAWRHLAEATALLGAMLYGVGWLFFALFFAEFDLTPEMAGISFGFIVVRVAVILIAFALCAALVVFALPGKFDNLASGSWRIRNGAFLILFAIVQLSIIAALILATATWEPWVGLHGPWDTVVAVSIIAVAFFIWLVEVGIVLKVLNYRAHARNILVARPLLFATTAVLIGFIFLGVFLTSAPSLASVVRQGGGIARFGFRVDRVEVAWLDDAFAQSLRLPRVGCATLLGTSGGNFVLYFPQYQRTVTVNSQIAVISRPLSGECVER